MRTKFLLKAKKFFFETFGDGHFPNKEEIAEKMLGSSFVPQNSKVVFSSYYTYEILDKEHSKMLEEYDINNTQLEILKILYFASKSTMTQDRMVKVMFVSKANVSTQLSKLEKEGLIERIENPENKREKIVDLTKAGEEKLYEITESINPWSWEEILEKDEAQEYIRLSEKIRKNAYKLSNKNE